MLSQRSNQEIDYTMGLKFVPGGQPNDRICLEFDNLNDDQYYSFQIIGVNKNGFGAPSEWSLPHKTLPALQFASSLSLGCGCKVDTIEAPDEFDIQVFQESFPGYTGS
eukprot:TRINITY_DN11313_c0_g1_i1.p4 TRINITY_DN11313_c0_g1~~TRINITY_DN11313_c0_g1_i1.p4  ORF type:complete len:108 (-),score=14.79 TRINITY_DN11313_c0_g1_i1:413-736(-)